MCSTKICYALHCYVPVTKIIVKYLSRASNLLDLQGSNLQLYKIRGVREHRQKTFVLLSDFDRQGGWGSLGESIQKR